MMNTMAAESRAGDATTDAPRELAALHEIARAFLAATHPVEVYRLALGRLTPMVRADFAAVFVRDGDDADVLKPVCVQGWPQASAKYLGRLRIRIGLGPTGRAVEARLPIEVEDLFADAAYEEWWEPARELGFASAITLPLSGEDDVYGALTFYFAAPRRFTDEERRLLRIIAEQLAATTARARATEATRLENERLRGELNETAVALRGARTSASEQSELVRAVCADVRAALEANGDSAAGVDRARAMLADLSELLELRLGRARIAAGPEDGVRLAQRASDAAGPVAPGVTYALSSEAMIVPIVTDGDRAVRILTTLLTLAFSRTARGEITLAVRPCTDETGRWVDWDVHVRGVGVDSGGLGGGSNPATDTNLLGPALARENARALGGEVWFDSVPGVGSTYRLRLPARRD